ncbi:MAG TPA: serine hydrolase domain-containing protein [Pseudonocardiaceae bacterium]|jgi:CubicO group peptidase (beta-lactamase class C family)|nr:serine hydrolase domain-containing protein [Pseudonocardiaceae bacterium]
MSEPALIAELTERATALGVPGVAVGIYHDGVEQYAFHGVTSVENPLPVDATTLFQFGSTGKTYTATAILRLVDQGLVDLSAPVRRYVPELRLKDESVAERVTVLHLLNHTAGWDGDYHKDTGAGDDALARYVAGMADIDQVNELGAEVSYNNASLSLAGRLIEKVTGTTYEQAIQDLLLDPIGLTGTYIFPGDIMTRRFAVGHNNSSDGTVTVARPWPLPRSATPAGGLSATAADQLAWARFHLADGRLPAGGQLLDAQLVRSMRAATVEMPGNALGDAVGISWMLRRCGEVTLVQHGGTTIGQHSAFVLVPERDFAVIVLTNCGPNGEQLNTELVDWALRTCLGVVEPEPEFLSATPATLDEYVGEYDAIAYSVRITPNVPRLTVEMAIKPEVLAELGDLGEQGEPIPVGLVADAPDQYVVTEGAMKGMRGYFTRDGSGRINSVNLGGRRCDRLTAAVDHVPG